MHYTQLGPFAQISRLTLGGGGLGQIWGKTSPREVHATIHGAIDAGINLIDTAPSYLNCEREISAAFAGKLPGGVAPGAGVAVPAPAIARRTGATRNLISA